MINVYRVWVWSLLIGVWIAAAGIPSASAQEQTESMRPGHRREQRMRGEGPHREKAREMMLSLKIWKVTEELAVDDALATRLYPAIRELEDVRFELRQSMERDAIVLRDALGVEPLDSDAVTRAVQTTKEHRRGYMRREFEKIDTILAMLTVEQQARFLLLEMEFEDDVRQFLRERRERRRGPSPAPAEFPQ